MTDAQGITANQIVKEYCDLFDEKPTRVDMGDRIIYLQRNGTIFHPHYKILNNGNILFGVGREYMSYDAFVIGISSWKIIKPNGEILEKSCYSDLETELTQYSVELSSFNERNDLIRF
jgi:hypothetical protein